jgi:ANTAR domain/GAF domain
VVSAANSVKTPAAALAAAAAALVTEPDMIGTLTRLCIDCAEVSGAAAAGIMLSENSGQLEVMAASSHKAEELDLYEIQAGQGPCIDAFRSGTSVACATPDAIAARWPDFAVKAAAGGFMAVQACPMRWRASCIGAINVFFDAPGARTDEQRQVVQAFADIATIAVIHVSGPRERDLAGLTHVALAARAVIEQAKGVIAARTGVDMAAAFDRLRTSADDRGMPLEAFARRTVETASRQE